MISQHFSVQLFVSICDSPSLDGSFFVQVKLGCCLVGAESDEMQADIFPK